MHLFAMAQIAGYALGGCWTHIGCAQSVVAYAFIQRDVDERLHAGAVDQGDHAGHPQDPAGHGCDHLRGKRDSGSSLVHTTLDADTVRGHTWRGAGTMNRIA